MDEQVEDFEGLDDKQVKAVLLMCAGKSRHAIVKTVGISRVTLWRWMQDPNFVAACKRMRQQTFRTAQLTLDIGTNLAAEIIIELASYSVNPSVQLAAAKFLIERRSARLKNSAETPVESVLGEFK